LKGTSAGLNGNPTRAVKDGKQGEPRIRRPNESYYSKVDEKRGRRERGELHGRGWRAGGGGNVFGSPQGMNQKGAA